MDHYDIVRNLTAEYAQRVIPDIDGLQIRFSNRLKYANAKCYPYRRLIVYNNKYINLNKNNIESLRYTIIEECVHLRHIHHSQEFYDMCIELGCDVRKPPDGTLFYWKYLKRCGTCGKAKFYYHKPRNMLCPHCGSESISVCESGL